MTKPCWRDELGTRDEFGINLFEILFLWKAGEASSLQELADHLDALDETLVDAHRQTEERLRSWANEAANAEHDPEITAFLESLREDQDQIRRRRRLLHHGLFLAAFAEFERILIDAEPSAGSAKDALLTLRIEIERYYQDVDNLIQRVGELQVLRNELSHGGQRVREEAREKLESLRRRKAVTFAPDGVIELGDGFLKVTLEELYRGVLVVLRVCGPLQNQLERPNLQ